MVKSIYEDEFIMSPKNDYAFKRIFGDERNKDVLISFLNAVLEENIKDVELLNTELKKEHIQDKHGILDIKAKTDQGVYVDVEIQLVNIPTMPKRTLYYWAKMYTEQMAPGESYNKLMKTVTINIVNFKCIKNEKMHNVFHIREENTRLMLTDVLEIHFLELTKLVESESGNEEKLKDWLMFIKSDSKEVFNVLAKKSKEINKAYDLLKKMSENKEERYLYQQRQAAIHDEVTRLEEGRKEGRRLGREQGLEEGRQEGRQEGREEISEEIVRNMKNNGLTDEQISEFTGIQIEIVKSIQK